MGEEVKNYLLEGRSRGLSFEVLKENLLKSGFSQAEVQKEIDMLEKPSQNFYQESPQESFQADSTEKPLWVKIVANVHIFVMPAVFIISSLVQLLSQKEEIKGLLGMSPNALSFVLSSSAIVIIFPLILSIIPIVVGINISKGKNGDRIFAIVLGFLFFLTNIFEISSSLDSAIWALISAVVIWGLLIDKKTRVWFAKKKLAKKN